MRKLAIAVLLLAAFTLNAQAVRFSGKDAFKYTQTLPEFGPRPSGSPELDKARKFIEASLASWKLKPEIDSFIELTPIGKLPMYNYIVKLPGTSDRVIIKHSPNSARVPPVVRNWTRPASSSRRRWLPGS